MALKPKKKGKKTKKRKGRESKSASAEKTKKKEEEEEGDDAERSWRRAGTEIEREFGGKKKEEEGRRRRGGEEEQRKKKPKKANRPKYTYRPKHLEIHQNGRNTLKHPEILPEVEWGVVSYRFTYRYEIFRPFRPERNGIYNYAANPSSTHP